jgi:hypothetical protein
LGYSRLKVVEVKVGNTYFASEVICLILINMKIGKLGRQVSLSYEFSDSAVSELKRRGLVFGDLKEIFAP